jgi:hypothetical protein
VKYDYQNIDRIVLLNSDDPMLFEIQIDQLDLLKRTYRQYGLPEPSDFPAMEAIEGWGKPPDMQFFEREKIPVALQELERQLRHELKPRNKTRDLTAVRRELKIIERFWEELESNQGKYAEEIEWISKMWSYRLLGKFLFINGKVTYITGVHWWYLNWWYLVNNILPQYRDRDRRWCISLKYFEVATTTFKEIDEETGSPVANAEGEFEMVDLGRRVFFGGNYVKARRVGDTSRIEAAMGEFVTRKMYAKCYIQGKDDENASTVFTEHFVQPFIKLPIFWKPIWDSAAGLAPKNGMLFDDLEDPTFGLHAILDFATSSDKAKLDGKFLHWFHFDEAGKLQRTDCNDVIGVVKFCLATGAGSEIHGMGASTTTVDAIEDQSAGENFMRFCQRSHFNRRNSNGQTDSGFVNVFFKAEDGLEGYIGPYGESVVDKPTPEQARYIGKTIGSRKFIENTINSYRRSKDWQGLALFRRQHPQCFMDCFTPPPKNQVLRRDLIEERLNFLQIHPEFSAIRGDFYWKGGLTDGEVGWRPDPEGRFYMSRLFLTGETNKRIFRDNMWAPASPDRFVGSPDTFGVNVALGRKSNGGLVIRWRRDVIVDPMTKDEGLVESDRDIVTYSFRPDTVDEYCEDMLMAHVYCGAMCYPERNKTNVIDHFRRRGYGGYLLYDVDRITGKPRPEPGWWNKNELVDSAIRWLQDDVVKNISRSFHPDLLKEYLEFGGRTYLTDFDLVASKLGTLIAEKNPYYSMVKSYSNYIDCKGWVPGFDG